VHPTGGSLRVFRHFAWLEVGSGKAAFSRLAHQRVTPAVGLPVRLHVKGIFMKPKKSRDKDNSWIWWIVILGAIFFFLGGCGGSQSPSYPFDTSAQDDADTAAEIREGQEELKQFENDPCLEDIMNDVPPEYQRCGNSQSSNDYDESDSYTEPLSDENSNSCPDGCDYHKAGCDIKGNISFDSGEKIYHVPGGEFYSSTTISPEYGERWFCTEAEAIANGWRKSFK
jgi:hypothetical protein